MEPRLFTLSSPFDGLGLSCAETVPEGRPKGLVQISHGMEEHKERCLLYTSPSPRDRG